MILYIYMWLPGTHLVEHHRLLLPTFLYLFRQLVTFFSSFSQFPYFYLQCCIEDFIWMFFICHLCRGNDFSVYSIILIFSRIFFVKFSGGWLIFFIIVNPLANPFSSVQLVQNISQIILSESRSGNIVGQLAFTEYVGSILEFGTDFSNLFSPGCSMSSPCLNRYSCQIQRSFSFLFSLQIDSYLFA